MPDPAQSLLLELRRKRLTCRVLEVHEHGPTDTWIICSECGRVERGQALDEAWACASPTLAIILLIEDPHFKYTAAEVSRYRLQASTPPPTSHVDYLERLLGDVQAKERILETRLRRRGGQ